MNPLLASHSENHNTVYWVPANCQLNQLPTPNSQWFASPPAASDFSLVGSAAGRGTTHFLRYQDCDLVLRHYKRGGLIGKLLDDQFLFLRKAWTRPVRELDLLIRMRSWHLPCPTPIAGQVTRVGLVWRGDLLTSRIPNAKDVHSLIVDSALSAIEWRHIGATIARFHKHQVYHHDLNIHNIMLDDEGQAWLIDFDKCAVRRGNRWKTGNLSRLHRSLRKEQGKMSSYQFKDSDWQALLEGYRRFT
ncbi:3-deoxy-D-manno-octulosonic acid kinase [Alteromonas flava]|uniref:3-deoxy-D-manno-octulosonic acid kinase n=1 Tax=Alteromonas flava TaxID=2048003 RepID=UPI0013D8F839|nr:3-deoxy-D-manno-octulosonic acid kinase [Alteromonas flava]